jgi:hypothetical protein
LRASLNSSPVVGERQPHRGLDQGTPTACKRAFQARLQRVADTFADRASADQVSQLWSKISTKPTICA